MVDVPHLRQHPVQVDGIHQHPRKCRQPQVVQTDRKQFTPNLNTTHDKKIKLIK